MKAYARRTATFGASARPHDNTKLCLIHIYHAQICTRARASHEGERKREPRTSVVSNASAILVLMLVSIRDQITSVQAAQACFAAAVLLALRS